MRTRILRTTSFALASVMVLALGQSASAAPAAPRTCAKNAGESFEDGPIVQKSYPASGFDIDSYGAADFRLTRRCKVISVHITGGGATAPTSEITVGLHKDDGGEPRTAATCSASLVGSGVEDSYDVPFSGCTLGKGRFWVVVQLEQDMDEVGLWGWMTTTKQSGRRDLWKDHEDLYGTGCLEWKPLDECITMPPNYLFAVTGRAS